MTGLHPDIERLGLLGWMLYPAVRKPGVKAACFKGASAAATCHLDTLEEWDTRYPTANWRVVTGPSRIWGLDLDRHAAESDGIEAFKRLAADRLIPPRPMTRSGGGGLAMFFRHDMENITGKTNYPEPGIDPRRGGLSVTVPPSIHHTTGRAYAWLMPPWEVNPPVAPPWLAALFAPPPEPEYRADPNVTNDTRAKRALIRAMQAVRDAPSGAANDTLNRRAYYVARCVASGALSETEAVEALYAAALDRRIPRLEARDTIKSAFRSGFTRPLERVS